MHKYFVLLKEKEKRMGVNTHVEIRLPGTLKKLNLFVPLLPICKTG
jgi:hypothetical protein